MGTVKEYEPIYHCGKSRDKNCNQKSQSLKESELENQILGILDKIEIPRDIYEWACAEIRKENVCEAEKRKINQKAHKTNYDRARKRIDNLIYMRSIDEITQEQFSKQKAEAQREAEFSLEKMGSENDCSDYFADKAEEVFDFASRARKRFVEGTPEVKKEILLNLGSNLQVCDRKLLITLDLTLVPFEKHAKTVTAEYERFKPTQISINTKQKQGLHPACPTRCVYFTKLGLIFKIATKEKERTECVLSIAYA